MNVKPATDDSPFFYMFEPGIPNVLQLLLGGSIGLGLILLFQANKRLRLPPLDSKHRARSQMPHQPDPRFISFYFVSLGLGFMLIEVYLIQKSMMFLGSPTAGFSIALFSMLTSSGLGGLYSRRLNPRSLRPGIIASVVIGVLSILYMVAAPAFLRAFLSYGFSTRVLALVTLIFPVGFFLGIPFPMAIRFLSRARREAIPWMWGLNGVFSLVGSVLAVSTAMAMGYSFSLLVGALVYLGLFSIGLAAARRRRLYNVKEN